MHHAMCIISSKHRSSQLCIASSQIYIPWEHYQIATTQLHHKLPHCIINLLACWHVHNTSWHWTSVHLSQTNINIIKIKVTLSKNVLRKLCLCHTIKSQDEKGNVSSCSSVAPLVFHVTHVLVKLFNYVHIRSLGVTIPKLKSRGTPKVI